MTLLDFLNKHNLNHTLLLGFYGGGNYGDELLLEVLAGLFKRRHVRNVQIAFQHPERYATFHHDFGYARVDMHDKRALFGALRRSKNIVVGGGGLWGLDANFNVLLMGLMLFASRWLFGKNVFLLAVGYYDSAPKIGKASAWLAAKASRIIIARDQESLRNFRRVQKRTYQDTDIAWHIDRLNLTDYGQDVAQLDKQLLITKKTLFITLRRFRGANNGRLAGAIADCIGANAGRPIIVALLEPRHVDPDGYRLLQSWQQAHANVQVLDFSFNPLALYLFFQKHHHQLLFIGPQFHAILSAHLTGVPFLPLAYDNKVRNLLQHIAPKLAPIAIEELRPHHIQHFIDGTYGTTA